MEVRKSFNYLYRACTCSYCSIFAASCSSLHNANRKRALQQLEASGQQIFGVAKTQKLLSENKKGHLLHPWLALQHISRMWVSQGSFLTALYGSWKRAEKVQGATFSRTVSTLTSDSASCLGAIQMSPETFFLSTLIVPPNRFRPPMEVGGAQFEHPQVCVIHSYAYFGFLISYRICIL